MLVKPTDNNVLPMDAASARAGGRHLGAILMDEGKLSAADAEQVLKRQRELGWRFGEAAIELNLITDNDLRQALAKQYEFPYLVSGPEGVSKELIAAWDPFHPVVEELRTVRTQLLIRWYNPGAGRRTLAIASPCAREGRSFIAANLAVVYSQLGERTLLIDANLRHPVQHALFRLKDRNGLSNVLLGRADLDCIANIPQFLDLSVLTAGSPPPNPQELLSRPAFSTLLQDVASSFDVVIIDTPATADFADAQIIASRCGASVLVARARQSNVHGVRRAQQSLTDSGAVLVGTVLNGH